MDRFRVRTATGDVVAADLEALARLVESGRVGPDDLMYDALTGEWAATGAHPAYLLVTDPLAGDSPEAVDFPPEAVEEDPDSEDDPFGDGALTAASPSAPRTEAPPAPVFDTPGGDPVPDDGWIVTSGGSSTREAGTPIGGDFEPFRPPEPPPRYEASSDEGAREPLPGASVPARPSPRASRRPEGCPPEGPTSSHRSSRRWLRSWVRIGGVAACLALALGVTATVARPSFRFGQELPRRASSNRGAVERVERVVPLTEEGLRSAAWQGFLEDVESIRRDATLEAPPSTWLDGTYLANASAHPEVEMYWTAYLRYVESVRDGEVERYRDGYLALLYRQGVTGPMRSLRLAAAMADFATTEPLREAIYQRSWAVARASLDLHEFLVAEEGNLAYEPADGMSADPVLEAVSRDPEVQGQLERALDRVLRALHGDGHGPRRSRDDAPFLLGDGLRSLGLGG